MTYMQSRLSLALQLWELGAVLTIAAPHELITEREGARGKERGFKLKQHEKNPDAPLSPLKFNLRPEGCGGPLTFAAIDGAARLMRSVEMQAKLQYDAIAGVPKAGDPFAAALARLAGEKPCLHLAKKEGARREVVSLAAPVPANVRVALLVDDLITKADSKLEAIGVLRKHGVEVRDVLVLIDRQTSSQEGRKALMEVGCRLHTVFTASQLLNLYREKGVLNDEIYAAIRAYLGN